MGLDVRAAFPAMIAGSKFQAKWGGGSRLKSPLASSFGIISYLHHPDGSGKVGDPPFFHTNTMPDSAMDRQTSKAATRPRRLEKLGKMNPRSGISNLQNGLNDRLKTKK